MFFVEVVRMFHREFVVEPLIKTVNKAQMMGTVQIVLYRYFYTLKFVRTKAISVVQTKT